MVLLNGLMVLLCVVEARDVCAAKLIRFGLPWQRRRYFSYISGARV